MNERDDAIREAIRSLVMLAKVAHMHHLNEEMYRVCLAIIAGGLETGEYVEREEFNPRKPVLTPLVPISEATPRQPWHTYHLTKERAQEYVERYGAIRPKTTKDTP